ncbi:transmembrane amino acid transporter protein-domain-containing protein [Radiomyces spectabilis]|uniref:transmembrane amino acid transporter protein-domain-containing protein n=1 Tax=Radiomyces spectabilis TaxID=64574 RepID=UPI00221F2539|nr:transmembrane amino acid transporter protein-domain-containing protein [Radiomyces spectabilis]KAI8393724.1 transmembrane amino acid transporter protein-domain-containing protein [Radiomyces spectabilis]
MDPAKKTGAASYSATDSGASFGKEDISCSSTEEHNATNIDDAIDREKQGSNLTAFFNVVCVVAGTGALGLPYALNQGGWIDTGVILIRCLYYDGTNRLTSYQEVAEASFGVIGGWIAFFFTAVTLIGVPVLYLLLAGQNLHGVCKGTAGELTFPIWTIICAALVAIPFVCFKSLKEIGVLSTFGTISTFVVIIIVLAVAVKEQHNQIDVHHDPVIWNMFPIALSSIAFSFGGNPVYAHVEAGMRRPQDWNKVILYGLTACVAMYFLVAVPGYYVYGRDTRSPIYDNLPNAGPKTASIVIITVHVLLAAPILLTSFALDLEKMLRINAEHRSRWMEWILRIALRGALMVVITVIAIYVPFFGDFMSLLGAFSNCALIFIFPVVFYFKLTGWRKPWYEMILAFFVILLGVVGLIFGTISAIQALDKDFKGLHNSS